MKRTFITLFIIAGALALSRVPAPDLHPSLPIAQILMPILSGSFPASGPGTGTFTLNSTNTGHCSIANAGTTCTIAVGTTAGDAELFACGAPNGNNTTPAIHITSVACGGGSCGTFVTAPGVSTGGNNGGGTNTQQSMGYILPSTSTTNASSVVITTSLATTSTGGACDVVALTPSANGSNVGLDIDGAFVPAAAGANPVGLAFTPSSTGYAVMKMNMPISAYTGATAVTSPYSTSTFFQGAGSGNRLSFAAGIPSNGNAETWTQGSVIPWIGTLALGWNPTTCVEQSLVNFEGVTNSLAVTAAQMANSIVGWQGGSWQTPNVVTGSSTYHFATPTAPGRLCGDGSSPTGSSTLSMIWTGTGSAQTANAVYTFKQNSSLPALSASTWFCSTVTTAQSGSVDVLSIHSGSSQYANVEFIGGGGGASWTFNLETDQGVAGSITYSPSDNLCTSAGDWVNLQLQYQYSASLSDQFAVYDHNGTQVGSTATRTSTASAPPSIVYFGNSSGQALPNGAIIAWDNGKIDLNGTFPLTR